MFAALKLVRIEVRPDLVLVSSQFKMDTLLQRQLEGADLNPDATTRLQAYQHAEQQLLNDVAWLPMFQAADNVLIRSHVLNMNLTGAIPFIFPDDWANMYISTH